MSKKEPLKQIIYVHLDLLFGKLEQNCSELGLLDSKKGDNVPKKSKLLAR